LRYVAAWGKWRIWTGTHWHPDETLRAFDLARKVCRSTGAKIIDPSSAKLARAVASANTVAAVERLARVDRRHAAAVDIWDADPWLLNTPGGIVDLRTGETLPHAA
jgi:putative DNA primase/helicase